MKKLIFAIALVGLLTVLLAACSGTDSTSDAVSSPNTVHMTDSNFAQSSITITKGSKLTLVSDTGQTHVITNGFWNNSTPQSKIEPGAPTVNATFQDNNPQSFGPFNTPGSYHLYCTVHPNMNLTVTVK